MPGQSVQGLTLAHIQSPCGSQHLTLNILVLINLINTLSLQFTRQDDPLKIKYLLTKVSPTTKEATSYLSSRKELQLLFRVTKGFVFRSMFLILFHLEIPLGDSIVELHTQPHTLQ